MLSVKVITRLCVALHETTIVPLYVGEMAGIVVVSFFAVLFLILLSVSIVCAVYLYKKENGLYKLKKKVSSNCYVSITCVYSCYAFL